MLRLLSKDKTSLGLLLNCKDVLIEKDLKTGLNNLSFSFALSDTIAAKVESECYIQTEDYEFVVKEVNKEGNEWVNVFCKPNIESLEGKPLLNFEARESKAVDTIRLAVLDTGWTVEEVEVITKKRTIRKEVGSAFDIINDCAKVFMIEIEFDTLNKKIKIYNKRGSDKGIYFMNQLNLQSLTEQADTYDFITRIIPIGKDNLRIAAVNSGKDYVDNFAYSNKVVAQYWIDKRYTDSLSLKEDAIAKLEEFSKPKKSYSASIYTFDTNVALGDTITLIDNIKNIKEKQRIVKIKHYPLTPEKDSIEIANRTLSFSEMQKELEESAQIVGDITTDSGAIDANKIEGDIEVPNGSVTSDKLAVDSVIAEKISAGSITAAKISANAITTDKINAGAVTAAKIAAGSITANSAIITDAAIGTAKITDAAITRAKIANAAIDSAKIDLLAVGTAQIQDLAVGTAQIADAAITNAKIGALAVDTAKIKDASITNAKIGSLAVDDAKISNINASKISAGDISADRMKVNAITAINASLGTATIDAAKIGALTADKITSGDISADRIKTNVISAINADLTTATIRSAKIGALDASKITTGSLTADRIKGNVITAINASAETATINSAKIGSLDASKITTGSLTADRIQANVIAAINSYTGTAKIKQAQIDSLVVGTANITDASITGAKIAAATITNGNIANATIDNAKIANLNASKINAGTLDATKVSISSTSGKLTLSDNTITIKDNQTTPVTRVQVGLDSRGKYGILVMNSLGEAIFDSDIGIISEKGLSDGVVSTNKIKNDSIDSSKLNTDELFVGENAFINKLKAVNIDAANITTGTISSERLDITGLVAFDSFDANLKPIFNVDGDKTYINGGYIAANTITANQIDLKSGLTVSGLDGRTTFSIADNGEVEVNGLLHSSNFSNEDNTGYEIKPDGTATFNQALVRGDVILPGAGLTNFGGSDASTPQVRIWAGGDYETRDSAKFRVYSNGNMYATNAILSGTLFGSLDNDDLTIKDGALTIGGDNTYLDESGNVVTIAGLDEFIKLSAGQTLLNNDVVFGSISDKRIEYSNANRFFKLNSVDFSVTGSQSDVIINHSSGAFGGLNIIGKTGGHQILRHSTASDKLGTLVLDSEGAQGERGDFSFTRANYTENVKVDIDGSISVKESINSSKQNIEMRSVADEGWGFYAT